MGQNYLSIVIAQGLIADLRERLYRHVQSLGLEFFTWTRAGEIHTRFLNDAGGLQNVLTQSFLGTFANLITLIGTFVVPAVPQELPATPREGIVFDHVTFHYPGKASNKEVLHDVSFSAPLGQLTALVGPSGAGKSTLLSLAARFYDPSSGSVRLEGIALNDIAQRDLRRRLAVVTQELFLFHASLRENICYGVPDATSAQVERRIQAALERLVEGRTVIAIAHRLSTIQRADQILVVQKGRIVERGTHEALLRQSGLYQRLYAAQFASELEQSF